MLYSTPSNLNNCKNQTLVLLIKSYCANVLFILQFSSCLNPEHCDEQCCQYSAHCMYVLCYTSVYSKQFFMMLSFGSQLSSFCLQFHIAVLSRLTHTWQNISRSPPQKKKRNVKAQSVKSICGHLCGQIITPTCTNIGKDFSKSCKWRFY